MKNHEIIEMVDSVEEYVANANVDELTGRMFRLGVDLHKADDNEAPRIALELALVVAFIQSKEEEPPLTSKN